MLADRDTAAHPPDVTTSYAEEVTRALSLHTPDGPVVRGRRTARALVGAALILLGALWILQGADVVRIRPLLCVADCQPVTGGSPLWLAIGAVTLVGGLAVVGVRRQRR